MLDLLQGIRIISFNHFLLGPMGIQALADLGADVIAVEAPEGAWQRHWSSGDIWHDGQGMLHLCSNRNKRSVALDLKAPKGRAIALKLIDGADVVAENFRPGVMDKLGFGYDTLRGRKPSLIYASASVKARQHIAGWYSPAPYGVYATFDGHVAVSLCPLQALADIIEEPRLASFSDKDAWTRQDEIGELIAARLKTKTTEDWSRRMEHAQIWHARVQDYADLAQDPQVKHMQALVTVEGAGETGAPVTLVNHPVRYDGEAAAIRLPPQQLGAQTREVLAEIGLGAAEIAALARDGVVRVDEI